jgi:hypothetical protein
MDALLLPNDEALPSPPYQPVTSSSYLTSITPSSLRSLGLSDPLTSTLLHSPLSSLRQPRAILDWVFSIGLNMAIGYGLGWLEWRRAFASSPIPLIDPWAEEEGRWFRGSVLVDLLITTLMTVLLMTLLQGTILQLEVSRALRRPIHPASHRRPFTYFPALLHPQVMGRIARLEVQVALPVMGVTMASLLLVCAGTREGMDCAVETETAIALKLAWTAVFVALYYPVLVVASLTVTALSDKRTQQYIDSVRRRDLKQNDIDNL